MTRPRFPAKEIKEFLSNPCKETLDEIAYGGICDRSKCHGCPFDDLVCPPNKKGTAGGTNDIFAWYGGGSDSPTPTLSLAELVLLFSEALARWEGRKGGSHEEEKT